MIKTFDELCHFKADLRAIRVFNLVSRTCTFENLAVSDVDKTFPTSIARKSALEKTQSLDVLFTTNLF